MISKYSKRFKCPCCGYPTLDEPAADDICVICGWEDDGQGDSDADIVLGGPNGNLSLTQARSNFQQYFVKYSPDNDTRITGKDTEEEVKIKRELIDVYDLLLSENDERELQKIDAKIYYLESMLHQITSRRIRDYVDRIKKGNQPTSPM